MLSGFRFGQLLARLGLFLFTTSQIETAPD
jgi:hypothetical protein